MESTEQLIDLVDDLSHDEVSIFVRWLCDNHTGYSNIVLLHVKFLGSISTYLVYLPKIHFVY